MQAEPDVNKLTMLFFVLVFFAATQGASLESATWNSAHAN